MRYINGFIMAAVLGLMCVQFAFAQAGPGAIRPLMDITEADADALQPESGGFDFTRPDVRYWFAFVSLLEYQSCPVWRPDGDAVYMTDSSSNIWCADIDSGEPELVADFRDEDAGHYLDSRYNRMYGFVPNSNELIVAGYQINDHLVIGFDVETGDERIIAEKTWIYTSSVSGRYYAYRTKDDTLEKQEEYIVDTITDNVIEMPGKCWMYAFTPNERYLIAVKTEDEPGIVQIDLETGEHTTLVDATGSEHIPLILYGITSNGEWVVFARRHWIEAYNLYTGETRSLLSLTEDEILVHGDLSPDNGTVAFSMIKVLDRSEVDGEPTDLDASKIYLLDIDLPLGDYDEYPLAVAEESPASFALLGNYPNPFNPTTTIGFTLSEPGLVNLTVYSVTGQAIRELVSEDMAPGRHSVVWDGRDDMGNQVAAGVYISRLVAGGQSVSGRMTLVK